MYALSRNCEFTTWNVGDTKGVFTMIKRISAAEWRKQTGADTTEPENPYAPSVFLGDNRKGLYKKIKTSGEKYGVPTEHQIQSAILDRLGLLSGAFFWRENSGLMKVGDTRKERFFRAGTPGIPDIMGVYRGHAVGIEVKRPGKKQSIDQRAFQQRFDQVGGIYIVCTDATQVVSQINSAISFLNERFRV